MATLLQNSTDIGAEEKKETMASPYYDPEMSDPYGFENAFSDKAIRAGFIRKVYSILMVQLAITVGFICMFLYVKEVKEYTENHVEMFWIAFVLMIILLIVLACCEDFRRTPPMNYACLFLFTFFESFLLGSAAGHYGADAVMMGMAVCTVVCLALTIFAFQTKWDFTMCGGILFVALVIFVLFGLVCIFIPTNKIVTLVYGCIGALIFSFYLVYDTQLMLGGSHKYSISPEEYIFAALNLYLDIVNLFLYIVQIIYASKH